MFNKNQLVRIKWNNTNREWFENKGYIYTKRYDEFYVKAFELKDKSNAMVDAICDYCGNSYQTKYHLIRRSIINNEKNACMHCASKKVSELTRDKRVTVYYNKFLRECSKRGYTPVSTIDDINDIKSYVTINTPSGLCDVVLDNFIRGHDCFKESYKKRNYNKIDIGEIKECIERDGNELLNGEEYTNCTSRCLKIRCKCGNIFKTSYVNYRKANVRRCHKCALSESSGEKKVREALDELQIQHEPQKRFDDCRDKKPLPFDFYVKDYNLIIEFDGQNHYYKVFENHESTIKHDKIKNEYCKQKGINLLRIPYWDGDKIKEIISNKILSLKI